MNNPLFETLLAPHRGSKGPFIFRSHGKPISYGEFYDGVAKTAGALAAAGLNPGDRLALQVSKSVEALQVYGACLMTGVIFLPLNTAYTPDEIEYFLADASPNLFICDPDRHSEFAKVSQSRSPKVLTLSENNTGSFADLVATAHPALDAVARKGDDIAALLYTSGTTGRSKGAMLTQDNLLSNAETLVKEWRITESDRLLHALPIFHAHGLFVAINTSWAKGASIIFHPSFQVDMVLEDLPSATTMMGVPTFYTRLLDDERFRPELVGNMRLFVSGSAPLLAETHERFEKRTGHRILERYGMTETGMNTSNPHDGERRAGTVGFPLPGIELKISDPETGSEMPDGEIGVIEVRGSNVFKGYWGMSEKTREDIREDGFFITGDLAQRDAEGYIHIVGRNKDLIITGGYNVYPKEVEFVLDEAEWVRESAVIGVPHPDFGEGVVAIVVPEKEKTADLVTLKRRIAASLAKFKQPKEIILIEELPRNTMGKVQKNMLRESYADLFVQQHMEPA